MTKSQLFHKMRKHIKNITWDLTKAFTMGFDAGFAGNEMVLPELPDPSNKRLYATILLAIAFYEDGYRTGKEARK